MSNIRLKGIFRLVYTLALVLFAFLISEILGSIISRAIDIPCEFLFRLILPGLAGAFLAVCLGMKGKVFKMAFASSIAWFVGLLLSIQLSDFVFAIYSMITDYCFAPGDGDGITEILAGVLSGVTFGAIVFGRKSIIIFGFVCGILTIPLGLLVNNLEPWDFYYIMLGGAFWESIGLDLYLLLSTLSFGFGIGLSIGLYELLTQKLKHSVRVDQL